jgi:hypothetical protein
MKQHAISESSEDARTSPRFSPNDIAEPRCFGWYPAISREAGPLDPPFWRQIFGTLFGLRSTTIYLAILFEKVRNRQCLCGFPACLRGIAKSHGAVERTRTSTVLLPPAPQAGASASSATTAQWVIDHSNDRMETPQPLRATKSLPSSVFSSQAQESGDNKLLTAKRRR